MIQTIKLISVYNGFYKFVDSILITIAKGFGYPKNTGLRIYQQLADKETLNRIFLKQLSANIPSWPLKAPVPKTLFDVIFSVIPRPKQIPKHMYKSKREGFYNFYVKNYRDISFLPDWLSAVIQIKLKICLDHSRLEKIRESSLLVLFIFNSILRFRLNLSWFLSINPFSFPWRYICALVDWSDELFQGAFPFILGINIFATFFIVILAAVGTNLNNLIFTMPFLPSEGRRVKILINGKTEDIILFRYLPFLWYKYGIPNKIREFWYQERVDILKYMLKTYNRVPIKLLPDKY